MVRVVGSMVVVPNKCRAPFCARLGNDGAPVYDPRRARTGSLDNAAFRAYPDEEGVSDRSRPILRQADPANWKGERFNQ
jgi:hypothetical protein